MDQQKLDLILNAIEDIKIDLKDFKEETRTSIKELSDRLTKVEKYLDNRHYLWDTVGKILAGLASGGAIVVVLLKIFGAL